MKFVVWTLAAVLITLLAVGLGRGVWERLSPVARRTVRTGLSYGILLLFAVVFVGPFVWMLSTSVQTDSEILSAQTHWLPSVPTARIHDVDSNGVPKDTYAPVKALETVSPQGTKSTQRVAVVEELEDGKSRVRALSVPTRIAGEPSGDQIVANAQLQDVRELAPQWHNYPDALSSFPFIRYTLNTLTICLLTMLGTVLSAALPAYGFARLRWKGRDTLFFLLIATIMLPPQVTMLPVFLIFRALGWTGTMLPLIVPSFFGSAFYIFLLRQFFLTIPQELSDAARIDGCNEFGILWRILAPIARPALATVALLSFTSAWMDFAGPLIYLHDERTYTLAIGLLAFLGRHGGEWSLLMAASTVMTVPMLVLFFFAQRTYIQGIALTGLKG